MLFDHNLACREPLLQTLEQMETEMILKDLGVGKGSIRNIIVHLINAEKYWISVLDNSEFESIAPANLDDIHSIREAWSGIHERTREFIDGLREEELHHVKSVTWGNQTVSFTVAKALIHVANHETHHRGLLSGLIRQQGIVPPDFDML